MHATPDIIHLESLKWYDVFRTSALKEHERNVNSKRSRGHGMPPAGLPRCPATEYDIKIEGAQVRGVKAFETAED